MTNSDRRNAPAKLTNRNALSRAAFIGITVDVDHHFKQIVFYDDHYEALLCSECAQNALNGSLDELSFTGDGGRDQYAHDESRLDDSAKSQLQVFHRSQPNIWQPSSASLARRRHTV